MKLNQKVIETLIVYVIVDVIILRLLFVSYLKRQQAKGKGQRYLVGVTLIFLGVLLTSFGMFLITPPNISQGWEINSAMLAGAAPFVCLGLPSLILGIFLVNNP